MKSFIELNIKKLPFIFIAISLIILFLTLSVTLIISILSENLPDLKGFWIIILVAGIGFPIFVIVITYVGWYFNRRLRINVLKLSPFDQLSDIGFVTSYIDDTKWMFTEETLEITINDFIIQFDVDRNSPKTVEFRAFVSHEKLDKEIVKRLMVELKKEEIHFDFDGIVKKYRLKKSFNLTIIQLETDLRNFAEKLSSEGFVPHIN